MSSTIINRVLLIFSGTIAAFNQLVRPRITPKPLREGGRVARIASVCRLRAELMAVLFPRHPSGLVAVTCIECIFTTYVKLKPGITLRYQVYRGPR